MKTNPTTPQSIEEVLDDVILHCGDSTLDPEWIDVVKVNNLAAIEQLVREKVIGHEEYPDTAKEVTYQMVVRSGLIAEQRQALTRVLRSSSTAGQSTTAGLRAALDLVQLDHWADEGRHLPETVPCKACTDALVEVFERFGGTA